MDSSSNASSIGANYLTSVHILVIFSIHSKWLLKSIVSFNLSIGVSFSARRFFLRLHLFSIGKLNSINFSVPYEWRSPSRYLSVIPFQLIGIVSCSEVCVIVLCLYTGLCVIMTTIAVDIERCLADLNSEIMIHAETGTNQAKIIKEYYEIIQFHSDSKE